MVGRVRREEEIYYFRLRIGVWNDIYLKIDFFLGLEYEINWFFWN